MPDYSKSKIYRIYCENEEYIGSTIRPLSERMNGHRVSYKNKTHALCSCKILFDKYGAENCRIELIEQYPCNTREELYKREGEIQRERNCINLRIAGRTKQQLYIDNREKFLEQKKQYRLENKEMLLEKEKQYRLENRELLKHRSREFRLKQKETL